MPAIELLGLGKENAKPNYLEMIYTDVNPNHIIYPLPRRKHRLDNLLPLESSRQAQRGENIPSLELDKPGGERGKVGSQFSNANVCFIKEACYNNNDEDVEKPISRCGNMTGVRKLTCREVICDYFFNTHRDPMRSTSE